jgi:hypothetical protein
MTLHCVSDLIGDNTSDEIITCDAFKDLISEISDFHPEFMKDFDFEDKAVDGLTNANSSSSMCSGGQLKAEDDNKDLHLMDVVGKHSSLSPLIRCLFSPAGKFVHLIVVFFGIPIIATKIFQVVHDDVLSCHF